MNIKIGLRGRFGGLVSEAVGFANAKQPFLPPGEAVEAPHMPYWPRSLGWAAPTAAAAGETGLAGAASGLVAGLGFGLAGAAAGGEAAGMDCWALAGTGQTAIAAAVPSSTS